MKTYVLILIVSLGFTPNLSAQLKTCDCKSDLIYLNKKVEKLPSYKRNKTAYKKELQEASAKLTSDTPYYECLFTLNQLLIALDDWHMGVIEKAADSSSVALVKYPVFNGDLDQLKYRLNEKSVDEIEGIYHLNKDLSFGLVYDENSNTYDAVVLSCTSKEWHEGDIVYKLIPLPDGFFKIIGAQYPAKRMIAYYERINEGVILRAGFKKDTVPSYYIRNPYPGEKFVYKEISPEIDYVKVGSFSGQYPLLKEAEDFYASLDGKLVKPHLILDLRDNGGGGNRNSNILIRQLKKYLRKNKVHLITNARTGSNAEQFAVNLKQNDSVISYGDKTRGALSYEIKPGDYITLPSSGFLAILPSKVHKKYLQYETKGVSPDYYLDYKKDWISTITGRIESGKFNEGG